MELRGLTAQDLVQRCLHSDGEAAWEEFVRRFQPLIARVIVKSVRRWTNPDPALIDDLIQNTYLKLCANNFRPLRELDFQNENALFGFLKVVASNVVQDHFRCSYSQKRGRGKEEEQIEVAAAAADVSFSGRAEQKVLVREVKQCLETYAAEPNFARDCKIFWLYYQQGLSAKAISQLPMIGLTAKGVESTLLRLIRMVREKLAARPAK
jgi:RNA polymerase sigma-70 factor (ECF subfamily)